MLAATAANHLVNFPFRDMLQFLFPRFAHILPFLTGAVQWEFSPRGKRDSS
jgi:hypothetical protein